MPGDQPARWVVVQRPGGAGRPEAPDDYYRVATADQVGQAITFDRAAEQSRAADVARQSDALKSALLQSVSHDLRTPLATIRAVAGSLRPGGTFSDADRQAGADAIEREVEYLDRLITNLLDLSRIEAGALRPKRELFDLDDLLTRALESTRARLGKRRLEADLRASTVEVDPVFVDEAVANVLDNVVKYTPDGALIRISATDAGPSRVLLTVEDDGPGVADEAIPRLFEKFYRAPRAGWPAREGTGIGLAVARGLVQATGGTVTARRSAALAGPLMAYLDVLDRAWPPDKAEPITFVVIPEYVAHHWWERILYNQSAKRLRSVLLGRAHTVVVDVPYRRDDAPGEEQIAESEAP